MVHRLCERHADDNKEGAYVVSPEHGRVERQELHRNHCKDPLQTVHSVRGFQIFISMLGSFLITTGTNNNWPTLKMNQHGKVKVREKGQGHAGGCRHGGKHPR